MPKLPKFFIPLIVAVVLACVGTAGVLGAQDRESSNKKQQYVASNSKGKATKHKDDPKKMDASTVADGDAAVARPSGGYVVGIDDELVISVWHEPELSQTVVVRPDGMITLPLLNDIRVSGLTTDELQARLTEKMKPLVNDPQVTVIVKNIKSRKLFLAGNVAKPGVYMLGGGKSVLELITEAGGLGPFAKKGSIYILRNQNGKQIRLPFNYKKALSGKGVDTELFPGDMVVVP